MTLNLWGQKGHSQQSLKCFIPPFHSYYLITQWFPPLFIEDFGTWLPVSASPAFPAIMCHFSVHMDNPSNNLELWLHRLQPLHSVIHTQTHTLNLLITRKLFHSLRRQYYWSQTTITYCSNFFTPLFSKYLLSYLILTSIPQLFPFLFFKPQSPAWLRIFSYLA